MMKNKIKKHVFGYDVFKENIPFSKLDKGDVLLNPHDEFKRNHNWSFLRMNDDYIELIDQSYTRLGKGVSILIMLFPVFLISLHFIYFIFNIGGDKNLCISFLIMFIIFLIWLLPLISTLIPYFKHE